MDTLSRERVNWLFYAINTGFKHIKTRIEVPLHVFKAPVNIVKAFIYIIKTPVYLIKALVSVFEFLLNEQREIVYGHTPKLKRKNYSVKGSLIKI